LRGGKFSNWEGGIKVTAFVTGGLLPPHRRGAKEPGLVAGWDWLATFAELVGFDPTDKRAAAVGDGKALPPIDSISAWPLLAGTNGTAARTELAIGDTSALSPNADGNTLVGGLIRGYWKLVVGAPDKLYRIGQDVYGVYPHAVSHGLMLLCANAELLLLF
jgi:arylsulfatase I/J